MRDGGFLVVFFPYEVEMSFLIQKPMFKAKICKKNVFTAEKF